MSLKNSGLIYLLTGLLTAPGLCDTAVPGQISNESVAVTWDANTPLSDYLAYAALHNPGLEAAFNRWQAALEKVAQARSLPDPKLTYRYFIREVETRVGPQRQAFELGQMFPWFGKLDLAGDVAAQAAQAQYHKYQAVKRQLFLEVRTAYYELYYLDRAIEVTRENMQLLQHLDEVARIRYSTATAQHPAVIKVQVELGKLEDHLKSLQDVKGPATARLNAALNRPETAPLTLPTSLTLPEMTLDEAALSKRLDQGQPDLLALDATVRQYHLATDLAQKDYAPNVTLGLSYVDVGRSLFGNPPDNGQDIVGAMVSLNLPIWHNRISAKVKENKLRELTALQQKKDLMNRFHARLQLALYHLHDALRKQNLYGDTLLPKAEESLHATEAAFRNGTGNFLDLIDAQRIYLEFQLAYQRAAADRGEGLADIQLLVGELGNESDTANVEKGKP